MILDVSTDFTITSRVLMVDIGIKLSMVLTDRWFLYVSCVMVGVGSSVTTTLITFSRCITQSTQVLLSEVIMATLLLQKSMNHGRRFSIVGAF